MSNNVLEATGLRKTYTTGPQAVTVWENVDLAVKPGESIAIIGASGSGKTSLLNVLGGLDELDAGTVKIAGQDLSQMSEKARTQVRNKDIGFVYQFHHLLAEFTALENIMMPLLLAGIDKKEAAKRAEKSLARLRMQGRGEHKPSELSGGERQRTAIARALVTKPKLVLLDEPTGNLDQSTASEVEKLMDELRADVDTAFVTVTHDQQLARRMERVFLLTNGTLQLSE
ncbi:MAG: ABC transporter ATP-binding protein [Pseudomonas sp.]|jgi:lipoprotein-releasing system ATP-binding protein|nr:ABC transporter ATP-binding protein [Pseudomonas sp.]PHR97328.1 MAG: lipoprotein-releasing system ATP-binding protein LolD [Oceanobacter sp.]